MTAHMPEKEVASVEGLSPSGEQIAARDRIIARLREDVERLKEENRKLLLSPRGWLAFIITENPHSVTTIIPELHAKLEEWKRVNEGKPTEQEIEIGTVLPWVDTGTTQFQSPLNAAGWRSHATSPSSKGRCAICGAPPTDADQCPGPKARIQVPSSQCGCDCKEHQSP